MAVAVRSGELSFAATLEGPLIDDAPWMVLDMGANQVNLNGSR